MNDPFFTFFISSASLAGIAVIWRNWIADHPSWKKWIQDSTGAMGRAVLCGSCFTYWITLAFTVAARPLSMWTPFVDSGAGLIANLFFQWMALAWGSVFLRFLYVALQELVHYQVHHLNDGHDSNDNKHHKH